MNLLITGAWQCTEEQRNTIRSMGHSVVFMQYEKDTLPCAYGWVEGVICNGLFLSHPIEKFTGLKFIQLTGVGYDRVPTEYIGAHNIELHNVGDVYSIPMAEYAVCGVLELYKKSRFFYENQKRRLWEKHRGLSELNGKTVLIVGCGNAGIACAQRFCAFGCHVIGVNRSRIENRYFEKIFPLAELDDVIGTADVLILSVALTEQTRHLIHADRLKKMKHTAVLVNISRGAVMDTAALIDRIDTLGGAVLDVFEEEPLNEDSPLWEKDNVILTPHNSFVGEGNGERINTVIMASLERNLHNVQ